MEAEFIANRPVTQSGIAPELIKGSVVTLEKYSDYC